LNFYRKGIKGFKGKNDCLLILLLFFLLILCGCSRGFLSVSSELSICKTKTTFTNPIIPAPSCDPWMIYHKGLYYYCYSTGHSIYISKTRHLTEIAKAKPVMTWSAYSRGSWTDNVWAPELHFIKGKWYIYFTADDGKNENHRMWVLESKTGNPLGAYIEKGQLDTQGWAIDGTVLEKDDGNLYFIWSGWADEIDEKQNIYIAPMKNPYTISGPRVLIAIPDQSWEQKDHLICEAPQALKNEGKIFIVYSANASWTKDYCLGMLINRNGDVLNPDSWEKKGPVFEKTDKVWGVGHCCFVKSPNMKEDWIIYHSKSKEEDGWDDRNVYAQPFKWDTNGFPDFGSPIPPDVPLSIPSEKRENVFL